MAKEIYGLYTGFKDFPGRYAMSIFLPGCNLDCWYCHNKEIAKAKEGKISIEEAREYYNRLQSRFDTKVGVCITGGEPTQSVHFGAVIKAFKDAPLCLHTNGLGNVPIPSSVDFDAIVLSLKTPKEHGLGKVDYNADLLRTMRRHRYAGIKRISVVDIPRPEYKQAYAQTLDDLAAPISLWKYDVKWVSPIGI